MFLKSKAKQKAHEGVGRGKYMPFLKWQITGVSCFTLQLFHSHRLWTQLYEVSWVLKEIMEITIFLSPSGKVSSLAGRNVFLRALASPFFFQPRNLEFKRKPQSLSCLKHLHLWIAVIVIVAALQSGTMVISNPVTLPARTCQIIFVSVRLHRFQDD